MGSPTRRPTTLLRYDFRRVLSATRHMRPGKLASNVIGTTSTYGNGSPLMVITTLRPLARSRCSHR